MIWLKLTTVQKKKKKKKSQSQKRNLLIPSLIRETLATGKKKNIGNIGR